MLSSVVPNMRGLTRLTCSGLTTIRVGKIKLPRVQRLALKLSPTAETGAPDGVDMLLSSAVAASGCNTLGIIIHFGIIRQPGDQVHLSGNTNTLRAKSDLSVASW